MRKLLGLVAKAVISLALLYFALARVDLGQLAERLAQIRPAWLLLAIAIVLLQTFLVAVRWRAIIFKCGAEAPRGRVFNFTMIGSFFNQTLPSTVGGDAARIWLLSREGAGWAKATYSVLIDRAAGVLMLAVFVVACLPWSFDLIRDPVGRLALLAIGAICIVGPAAFIAFGFLRWDFLERWWLSGHLVKAARAAKDVLASPGTGASVAALSFVIHGLTVVVAWCAARSVAAPFDLVHSLLLMPPVLLIATVPVSIAGWGVRESAMVLGFAYAGLPESDGLLVSVLFGAASFAVGAIGGLVWLASASPFKPSAADEGKSA